MSHLLVVMGASGCGKTTLARALARSLHCAFIEGDLLHPQANIDKMKAGVALSDADRTPFLLAVADALAQRAATGAVASCSALRRQYRDVLREHAPGVTFILPLVPRGTMQSRVAQRRSHFMPASLLDSQLATFEMPDPDEAVIQVDGRSPTPRQVQHVLAELPARSKPATQG